jgi:hypothetical protein
MSPSASIPLPNRRHLMQSAELSRRHVLLPALNPLPCLPTPAPETPRLVSLMSHIPMGFPPHYIIIVANESAWK